MPSQKKGFSSAYTLGFIIVLSFSCALILSVLASALKEPQETAQKLDQSKQMLMSTQIFNSAGYFQIKDAEGNFIPANLSSEGILVAGSGSDIATDKEILEVFNRRIQSFLINDAGEESTFKSLGIDEQEYTDSNRKTGYEKQEWKLAYRVLGNEKDAPVYGYVFPVSGMGLWGPIYGYIAIEPNGVNVIGISWYEHIETPGLGANISEPSWQDLFPGKSLFQQNASGKIEIESAPLGITVVRGKVVETIGDKPKAKSAVDGMAGATITGTGVTKAYKESLGPYRPFLEKMYKKHQGV